MKKILFIFIIAIFISLPLYAGTTGKLAGKVKDDKGKAIPMANVFVDTLKTGATCNENGQYIIINLPPGTYDIRCFGQGWGTAIITGVQVNMDQTTALNFTLEREAVDIEGVTITEAKNQNIKADKMSSGNNVSAETIADIGAQSIEEIVAIQAGAATVDGELHVRGGRSNEVNYTVDGMSVSDPVDGGSALTIDQDAIADMSVMTGGFTAEYGNAQSGVVNIVTKSGSGAYSGKMEMNTDHLFSDKNDTSNEDEVKLAIGGPVLGDLAPSLRDDLTFFINGAGLWTDGRFRKYYLSDPNDDIPTLESDFSSFDPYQNRDEIGLWDIGDRNYNYYNGNLKIKYQINPTQNLTFAARGDITRQEPYSNDWRYAMDHYFEYESQQNQYIVTYDHLFNPQMNLKIKGSAYTTSYKQQPKGIDRDMYFVQEDASEWEKYYMDASGRNTSAIFILDPEQNGRIGLEGALYGWQYLSDGNYYGIGEFVSPGSIAGTYLDDSSSQYSLRADFEYQVNLVHGLKSGFEIIKHNIEKDRLFTPWTIDDFRYDEFLASCEWIESYGPGDSLDIDEDGIYDIEIADSTFFYSQTDNFNALKAASGTTDGYRANPWQAAYYLQDRMEWEGMIVNAGLRFDFWYLGEDYDILNQDGTYRKKDFADKDKFQLMLSPRLGISHPISERSVLHFAYNYQNQLPQMQYIFTTADSTDAYTSNTNVVVGNPDLEPQITVTYEVGLQQQLSEYLIMDITAYYKNIYNYVSTQKVYKVGDETVYWYEYISEDYGSARGVDINLTRPLSNFISGSAAYSLAWANGNNSDTVVQDENTNLREFPLDWDIRHSGNLNLAFKIQKDEDFYFPYLDWRVPLDDFSISFNFSIASGAPYTPVNEEDTALDVNSANRPYTSNSNLTIYKRLTTGGKSSVKVYFTIDNLFNKINYSGVYPRTGDPWDDGLYSPNPNGSGYIDRQGEYVSVATYNLHQLALKNPSRASSPRTYSVGFTYNW
ncbi:MAG: carboxypeptidase regulatory-like domain-containing protein [Candidatus Cloacimonetes bacterium]|nr:carboxypeptidase regulatory-like domain-containing protein [Candidatus Cloacimonadota bacterium]